MKILKVRPNMSENELKKLRRDAFMEMMIYGQVIYHHEDNEKKKDKNKKAP